MTSWQDPGDPDPQVPPREDEEKRSPFDRPPFDEDPEAQHAPGDSEQGLETPPPMQAMERVGNDNIREGHVGGVMGAPSATNGQGQGG